MRQRPVLDTSSRQDITFKFQETESPMRQFPDASSKINGLFQRIFIRSGGEYMTLHKWARYQES